MKTHSPPEKEFNKEIKETKGPIKNYLFSKVVCDGNSWYLPFR